tara:strand:+ start:265 stop:390 length:126 start_codon:yes stop_codon:yes gene_type:complete
MGAFFIVFRIILKNTMGAKTYEVLPNGIWFKPINKEYIALT